MKNLRQQIEAALAKPTYHEIVTLDDFDPWNDIIHGIYGSYAAESDRMFIAALIAVRDRNTFDFIKEEGFMGEFCLYVLAGHGYLEYGGSPRGAWWDYSLDGLLQPLIDKWQEYYTERWG